MNRYGILTRMGRSSAVATSAKSVVRHLGYPLQGAERSCLGRETGWHNISERTGKLVMAVSDVPKGEPKRDGKVTNRTN